jgi:hypothetical protein
MTDESRTEGEPMAGAEPPPGALVPVPPRPPARRLGAAAGLAGVGVAIGSLVVGRLGVGRARIRRLEIDNLIVHRISILEP